MEVVTITPEERISTAMFPKLYRLHLNDLPELSTFCNLVENSIELHSFAELWLENCPEMHTFVSKSPHADVPTSIEEYMNFVENLHSHIKPLFDEKVPFPKVEQLALELNWIVEEMLHGKFSEYSYNLKVLELISANKESAICPYCFLYTLPNLERVNVYSAFFEEIFICEALDCKEKHLEAPSKLIQMELFDLKDSLHL
ncbi:hypothetical protein JRO89_XS13G0249700 [Xanthoceras sorbifolium]|uniref:Uncharacterized protein n=1 Tax=Xanthoceras sorbifolium TaxID=99658 RepID=A0ABQ8H9U8_9ROSI|nr:hypothetical protein JRO89_XS13G0249700 [Xanthoceras sorbifolium]